MGEERPRGPGTLCRGLGFLCGSELEVRSHVGDLDLDGLRTEKGPCLLVSL